MRRLHLSTILIGINAGLVLLAVAGVALAASSLLQRLADEQGLARVAQAGASAHQEIVRAGEDVAVAAQLLAERPTLRRLLQQGDTAQLEAFLGQFQRTSQLGACAVLRDGRVIGQSGALHLADATDTAPRGSVPYRLVQRPGHSALVLQATTPLPAVPGASVATARALDDAFAGQIAADIGLPVQITGRAVLDAAGARQAPRARALASGTMVTTYLAPLGPYVAVHPLRAPGGEIVGFVEVDLPATSVTRQLQELTRTLALLAIGTAALAALGSLAIGRWLVRPLARLGAAAARIGRGDLATPVPMIPGAEGGALAAALDEMRRQLLHLTADLRRQQAEAYAIVTGISEGVFTVDRERRIRYMTPQAAAMLGISSDEAIGRFCGDVLNPQGPGGVRPCDEHCPIVHARFRGGARATEHLLLRSGERRTIVITSAAPAETQQVQVLRDETEVEATRRLRDTVLGNISHEFRTPLSAQLASIELLLDQLPDLTQAQIAQLIQAQQRGTLRLAQLIDNLLESVRIEAGHQSIRHQPVALDEVIEEAIELTRPLLQQREQAVALDLPYPLPLICGDATRLVQVFVNLLANANKFAPASSPIHIGGSATAQHVTVWVEDRGPGLPPLASRALFSRFVRAAAEEPEQSGIGLGLAIVQSIVERHGGHVHAQSTGGGTRMVVVLPTGAADENPDRR
ncbi:MAG TPA: ATP-binding protein [Roseiflexaceae bacterium]|nr:ATP-binding protein [Roseiflexaceae bacterium]